jgi:hypothetical protein
MAGCFRYSWFILKGAVLLSLVGCENVPEMTVQNTHTIVAVVTPVVVYDGKQQSTLSDV